MYLGPVACNRGTQTGNAACGFWQSRGSLTFRLNRGLRLPAMGQSHGSSAGPTAWEVRDKLGSSAAQMSGAAVSHTGGSRIYTGPVL